jgi:hypothetical protein
MSHTSRLGWLPGGGTHDNNVGLGLRLLPPDFSAAMGVRGISNIGSGDNCRVSKSLNTSSMMMHTSCLGWLLGGGTHDMSICLSGVPYTRTSPSDAAYITINDMYSWNRVQHTSSLAALTDMDGLAVPGKDGRDMDLERCSMVCIIWCLTRGRNIP